MNGALVSPDVYEVADQVGLICHFEVNFTPTDPYPILSVLAKRQQNCAYTQIELRNTGTNVLHTFPLPNSGTKDANGFYTATVSAAQAQSQGFTNRGDIGSRTVS